MKPIIFAILAMFFLNIDGNSQKPKMKFGKVTLEELQEKNFPIDTTAEAIILFEKGITIFGYDENTGFFIDTEYFIKKKFLKKSALDQAVVKLSYIQDENQKSQSIMNIKGFSYWTENGGFNKLAISDKDIFDEKLNKKYYQKSISFPQVKTGSIIEYSYVLRTPLSVKDKPENWFFQGAIPKLWSEYEITIPSYLYYQITMGGNLPLVLNDQNKVEVSMGHTKLDTYGLKYNFAVANAPSIKAEPFMNSILNNISKVEFELSSTSIPTSYTVNYSTTWDDVSKTLLDNDSFGKRIKKTDFLKTSVETFEQEPNKIIRLEKIYYNFLNLVETDNSFNSIYGDDLKKAFTNKKATATEKNLMLIGFLQELGYNANPLILSTRKNGKINKNFPLLDRFNYTICNVDIDGINYTLDISKPQQKFGMLPFECLNGDGRLIQQKNSNFIPITPSEKFKYSENLNVKIDKVTGKISGKYEKLGYGYSASNTIDEYQSLGKEKFIEKVQNENPNLKTTNFEFVNFDNVKNFPTIKFDVQCDDIDNNDDLIYLNPMLIGKVKENIFKQEKRVFPIDFGYNYEISTKILLEIPDNYSFTSLPKNITLDAVNNTAQFVYSARFDEETKQIIVISKIFFKNTIYPPEKYKELKDFYGQIVQKHEELIVLKRK